MAVREAIERVQPLLSLHRRHIYKGRGMTRIGTTFCVNPQQLRGRLAPRALVILDDKKAKVKNYVLVNG